jgi:hypothetical protein
MSKIRGSRVAFAAAYLALVVGLFVALGGAAYAQESPSSATDQYSTQVAGVSVTETSVSQPQVVESQALPLTGLSLLGVAVVGAGLVALGFALRRRERHTGS